MSDLKEFVLEAHGGLARWSRFGSARAHLIQGGALWGLKGKAGVLDDVTVTVDLKRQRASHTPFGRPSLRSSFEGNRIALEGTNGKVIAESLQPRSLFAGHTLETPWDDLQLAFFAGCAMWTYLNSPFVLAWPGVSSEELTPWEEKGETWQRLSVHYPDTLEVFSKQQTMYFGPDGLLRRMDYDVEIAGGTPGAHYVSEFVDVNGIKIPTRRRIYPRHPDGHSLTEPLVVSIDLDGIELTA